VKDVKAFWVVFSIVELPRIHGSKYDSSHIVMAWITIQPNRNIAYFHDASNETINLTDGIASTLIVASEIRGLLPRGSPTKWEIDGAAIQQFGECCATTQAASEGGPCS